MPQCEYTVQRALNIEKNKELLKSLGLDKPFFEPKENLQKPKPAVSKKRKIATESEEESQPAKIPRSNSQHVPEMGVRRSSRNVGKVIDYKAEQQRHDPLPLSYSTGIKTTENTGPLGRESGIRKHDPKTFGAIPGIEVGTWWESRQGCSTDSIHAPWVAGISGGKDGAYSVALSGGYPDDVDLGYAFTYTGSGGRDLKGTKADPKNLRTAPQSFDQSFENSFNKALKRSAETKRPVRVIRGFKLKSPYAPSEGYRYDGLYQVEKAWMEKGLTEEGLASKYLVCKFAFKRLPGQPPLPVKDESDEKIAPEAVKEHLKSEGL